MMKLLQNNNKKKSPCYKLSSSCFHFMQTQFQKTMLEQSGIEFKYYRIRVAKIVKPKVEELQLAPTPEFFTYIHSILYHHMSLQCSYLSHKVSSKTFERMIQYLDFIQIGLRSLPHQCPEQKYKLDSLLFTPEQHESRPFHLMRIWGRSQVTPKQPQGKAETHNPTLSK